MGVHTFTHVNLAGTSQSRYHRELDLTQLAIAGATGQTTDLLRMPYSSEVQSVTASEWQAMQAAENYRIVFTDLDTRDWERPGVSAIVAAGLPKHGHGAVVMMHDGGGDRSQTVAGLRLRRQAMRRTGQMDALPATAGSRLLTTATADETPSMGRR